MNLKYGVALPYPAAREIANLAREAEEAGWDGVYVGDAIWCQDPMIGLAAAAMVTSRIRLGTMIIPAPLRRPWKIASEAIAVEHLSNGRLTLGLGAGAVWMGWQAFPDEVTDKQARTEMLDETIDILKLLFQGKQFDYNGKHYHLKLTQMDEQHYPPRPIQQPRIPLWVVGVWPHKKSMQRVLKADGLLPQKMNAAGEFVEVTPEDIREMRKFIESSSVGAVGVDLGGTPQPTPFDIVVEGKTSDMDPKTPGKLAAFAEAGATWWIEGMWGYSLEDAVKRIRQGPPQM